MMRSSRQEPADFSKLKQPYAAAQGRYESTPMPRRLRKRKYWLLTLNKTSSFWRSSLETELVLSSDALMICVAVSKS